MPLTAAKPEPTATAVGGVRASWWNAVVSVAVAVIAAHVPVGVHIVAGSQLASVDGPAAARFVVVAALGTVSLLAQLAMIPWLRAGLAGGITSPAVAVVASAAGIALWVAVADTGLGAVPLVAALSLIGCAGDRITRRALFLLAVVVAVVAWALASVDEVTPLLLLFTVGYPYIVFASVWAWDVVTRLDAARATQADLAVARERLRFAADLHDIQGHSLQVIALKAELAERLLEVKPDAAAVQLSEVRVEAADALGRTRELARGYRATGIEEELDNARDVLTVAGFECTTEVDDLPGTDPVRSLFGRALREATTNVLRHAGAGPVRIGLGRRPAVGGGDGDWQLTMVNRVAAAPGDECGARDGAGLVGLADRVERLGGGVETEVRDDAGTREFILTVSVPAGTDSVRST